jgi:hypothetical protein
MASDYHRRPEQWPIVSGMQAMSRGILENGTWQLKSLFLNTNEVDMGIG